MADLDLGTEAINQDAVIMPSEEHIYMLYPELTRVDRKWSQHHIVTTQRTILVNDSTFPVEDFAEMNQRAKAMYQTPEGQAYIQAAKAALKVKPLALKTEVVSVETPE